MKVYAVSRTLIGANGSRIIHLMGFRSTEALAREMEEFDKEFMGNLAKCHVVADTPQGPRPVMPLVNLLAQLGIADVGTQVQHAEMQESNILVPRVKLVQ